MIRKDFEVTVQEEDALSPTVAKVLDEYLTALKADEDLTDDDAARLDELLRTGKVPKWEELEAALFPSEEGDRA